MEDYKANSRKLREKQNENQSNKKIEKVVSGTVTTKKKTGVSKFADVFMPEDINNVKSYILQDVLIPAAKKAISDVIDMLLYGESGRNKKTSTASKISYRSYFDSSSNRRDPSSARIRNGFEYDELLFDTRGDAEAVLDGLDEALSKYGVVSVGDLYDLADVSTNNYMVNEYGWSDIRCAAVVRVKDKYMLKLPKAKPID